MTGIRLIIACGVALLVAPAAHAEPRALDTSAAVDAATVERFTFEAGVADSEADAPDRFELVIDRWSSDAERDRLHEVATAGDAEDRVHDLLRGSWAAGRVHWPGNLSYTLRYARRTVRPDGGENIVVATDAPIWQWWTEEGSKDAVDGRFSVIHLRIDPEGQGEGRLAFSRDVAGDAELGIVVERAESGSAALRQLRRQTS